MTVSFERFLKWERQNGKHLLFLYFPSKRASEGQASMHLLHPSQYLLLRIGSPHIKGAVVTKALRRT